MFNSEKDLIYFLFNFETKINEIALFKKIILCDYYKENYMFFAARAGQKEVEEETDRIRNVHSYMFTNNFYINYCNSSLPNTYRFETSIINLENDYDKIIDDVLFEGRYINRYKPVIGDEDEDYFGENFMKILDYEVVSVFS